MRTPVGEQVHTRVCHTAANTAGSSSSSSYARSGSSRGGAYLLAFVHATVDDRRVAVVGFGLQAGENASAQLRLARLGFACGHGDGNEYVFSYFSNWSM